MTFLVKTGFELKTSSLQCNCKIKVTEASFIGFLSLRASLFVTKSLTVIREEVIRVIMSLVSNGALASAMKSIQ